MSSSLDDSTWFCSVGSLLLGRLFAFRIVEIYSGVTIWLVERGGKRKLVNVVGWIVAVNRLFIFWFVFVKMFMGGKHIRAWLFVVVE